MDFILPDAHTLHPKIRNLLLDRYLASTCLCHLIEYPLLAYFILYLRFIFSHPIDSSNGWLLLSLNVLARMQLMSVHMILYTLLQWQIDERPPTCHVSQQELLQKLYLLIVLVSFGYWSSWLYLSFVDALNIDVDVSYTGHYLCVFGAICGFSYFLTEHLCFGNELWPLPKARVDDVAIRSLCQHLFGFILPRCIGCTSVLVALYWPNMAGGYSATWQFICLYGCLTTLISAKLYVIKWIYGLVMHHRLPLSEQWDHSLLPMAVALSVDNQLFGFQMLAAWDFHEIVSGSCRAGCPLFQLQGFAQKRPKNWEALRDVLLQRIRQFSEQLGKCPNLSAKSVQSVKRSYAGLRPLMTPMKAHRFWSLRGNSVHSNCRPLQNPTLQQMLQSLISLCISISIKCSVNPDQEQSELCCGRSLIWLIDGLVCICVRSLKEDTFGVVQCDLEPIFQCLVDLDKLIQLELKRHSQPCETLRLISLAVQRSLNNLTVFFYPYLSEVVLNRELLLNLVDNHQKLTTTELC